MNDLRLAARALIDVMDEPTTANWGLRQAFGVEMARLETALDTLNRSDAALARCCADILEQENAL